MQIWKIIMHYSYYSSGPVSGITDSGHLQSLTRLTESGGDLRLWSRLEADATSVRVSPSGRPGLTPSSPV